MSKKATSEDPSREHPDPSRYEILGYQPAPSPRPISEILANPPSGGSSVTYPKVTATTKK